MHVGDRPRYPFSKTFRAVSRSRRCCTACAYAFKAACTGAVAVLCSLCLLINLIRSLSVVVNLICVMGVICSYISVVTSIAYHPGQNYMIASRPVELFPLEILTDDIIAQEYPPVDNSPSYNPGRSVVCRGLHVAAMVLLWKCVLS